MSAALDSLAWVHLRFAYAGDLDLKAIRGVLDKLVQQRNRASYDLRAAMFSSPVVGQSAVRDAAAALALLDRMDADPGRRSGAIRSIRA